MATQVDTMNPPAVSVHVHTSLHLSLEGELAYSMCFVLSYFSCILVAGCGALVERTYKMFLEFLMKSWTPDTLK